MIKFASGFAATGFAVLFMFSSASSASSDGNLDAFSDCMHRTEKDRVHCSSGCGMILQQCYDEGISDFNQKSSEIIMRLSSGAPLCAEMAKSYESSLSQLSGKLKDEAEAQSGWFGDELELHLAKQKLATLQLISKECK